MINNIIEVRYTSEEWDNILTLKDTSTGIVEEIIQVGSLQHKALEEAGYDHEKIVDGTAEYKKNQLAALREAMMTVNRDLYDESIKKYEKLVDDLKEQYFHSQAMHYLQMVRSQALAKRVAADAPAKLKAANEYIAKNVDPKNVNASFDSILSFLRAANDNKDIVDSLKERVSKDSESSTIIDLLKELL
jgi:plasmid maintenance system killer protein